MKKYNWIFGTLLICMVAVSCFLYPYLPKQIPIHWNAEGMIDSYGDRMFLFLPIGLYLFLAALFPLLRRLDPRSKNYVRFERTFDSVMILMLLFLFCLWAIICLACFYPDRIDIPMILSLLISILFVIFGNLMPKIKSNFMIGIKTPWTLSNETVWLKTHRFTGKLWFVGGFVMMAGILLPSSSLFSMVYLLGCVCVMTLIPCIYSYMISKNITHSYENEKGRRL